MEHNQTMKSLRIILLALSVVFFGLNFVHYNINEQHKPVVIHEKFDPSLSRLNTLDKLIQYTDSSCAVKQISQNTLEYAIEAKEIVSQRFYHKYSTQNLSENWIASVSQWVSGYYLSSKITADDILKKSYGYCGQQSAVLMGLLEKKGLDCRAVYFSHHFAMQAYINKNWCFFDPNQEPDILPEQRGNKKWLYDDDSLAIAYKTDTNTINKYFGHPIQIKYGKVNEVQGPNAQIFQAITKILSRIAFIFPLLWFVYLSRKNKVNCSPLLKANNPTQEPPFLQ
jgi:hypothetical protein